ncbi:hypothetical protein ACFL5G_03930, partial [Candidatus Margulisiibacteriota bacterium]
LLSDKLPIQIKSQKTHNAIFNERTISRCMSFIMPVDSEVFKDFFADLCVAKDMLNKYAEKNYKVYKQANFYKTVDNEYACSAIYPLAREQMQKNRTYYYYMHVEFRQLNIAVDFLLDINIEKTKKGNSQIDIEAYAGIKNTGLGYLINLFKDTDWYNDFIDDQVIDVLLASYVTVQAMAAENGQ